MDGSRPLLLAVSVWTAAKHAPSFISAGAIPKLNAPATNEELLMRMAELTRPQIGGDGEMRREDHLQRPVW